MKNRYSTEELTRLYKLDEHLPIVVPTEPEVVTIVDRNRRRSYFVLTASRKVIGTAGPARPH